MRRHLPVLACVFLAVPAAHAAPPLPPDLDVACLETILEDCTVLASGRTGVLDGPSVAFQVQHGTTEQFGTGGGIVLFAEAGDDWVLLAQDFDGFQYEVPRVTADEAILLHVPGIVAGTGSINADLLFAYDEAASEWRPVDLESWKDDIASLLPEGLAIWKGVDYDFADWSYAQYDARTQLWQESDANCCPTGGSATIHFDIVDHVLVARAVDYQPPWKGL